MSQWEHRAVNKRAISARKNADVTITANKGKTETLKDALRIAIN